MEQPDSLQLLRLALQCHKLESDLALSARLTVNELNCLLQIHIERPCCIGMLTTLLGIGGTSTSKLLRSLDRRKLISRTLAQNDRRQETVRLTADGLVVVRRVLDRAGAILEEMRQNISGDKYDCLTRCLQLFPIGPGHTTSPAAIPKHGQTNKGEPR
jgi:DNA-binding MarR family transcriptional regulator